ncbi:integral membrane protein [alpha proteobacterium U9-1i]|nr:integral membrane protein [alpha proteobacterium U9-1i]
MILVGLGKGGFSGLGALCVPVMALAISPVQAAAILLPILMVQDVVTTWIFRGLWDLRQVGVLIVGGVAGVFAGFVLAATVSVAMIELALGGICILFGLHRLWVERGGEFAAMKFPAWVGVAAGAAAGFTSQLAHAGGPPIQMYYAPQRVDRDMFLGTTTLFFTVLNWVKLPAFAALGQLTITNLAASIVLLPLAIVATWIGARLARSISSARFFRVIYALMIVLGLKLCWDGVAGLT